MKICSTCNIEKNLEAFAKNKSKKGGYQSQCKTCVKTHYSQNRAIISKRYKTWYEENKIDKLQANRSWYSSNKESRGAYNKEWRNNNVAECRARNMLRYANKKHATPPWLTSQDKLAIEKFYIDARQLETLTGKKYHVDHIVPLQGENVCGLHVPWNLQILEASENIKKGNKHE